MSVVVFGRHHPAALGIGPYNATAQWPLAVLRAYRTVRARVAGISAEVRLWWAS